MKRRKLLFWSGIAIIVGGLTIAVQIPYFYWRSHVQGERLLNQAKQILPTAAGSDADGHSGSATAENVRLGATWTLGAVQPDTLVGGIRIPAIAVEAPILQGTEEAELDVGAGHLTTSVWPGESGTCVIAAHNATWFRHIDELHKGDTVDIWTKAGLVTYEVTQSQVVHTGTPVPNSTSPSLVLEACYPLDALYLTPNRYLVYAKWLKTSTAIGQAPGLSSTDGGAIYHGEVPQDLIREGLTLSTNSLPMGSLHFTGTPDATYTQSQSPLSASSTLVQLYLAWVHASADKNLPDIMVLLPSGSASRLDEFGAASVSLMRTNNPLWGAALSSVSYESRFDVTLDVAGSQLNSATGSAVFVVSSKRYRVTVTADVGRNQAMAISGISVVPL